LNGTTIWYACNCPTVGVPLPASKKSTTLAPSANKSLRRVLACVPPSASTISTLNPPGVHVGVAEGEPVAVGVGLAQPPLTTLISTEVVVVDPVYPPTATAVLPTCVPAG